MPIASRVNDPGFTPAARDVPAVLDLLATGDEDTVDLAEKALLRAPTPAAKEAMSRLADAKPPFRGRLARLLGRLAESDASARDAVFALASDADLKTRRNALAALGHLDDARVEDALLAAWDREERIEVRRTIASSLGKKGSARALAVLRDLRTDDPELARIASRATRMVARTETRGETSEIDVEASFREPIAVVFGCRAGLEEVLRDELGPAWKAKVLGPGAVRATLDGPLRRVFQARTWLTLGFRVPPAPIREGLAAAVASAIASKTSREILRAFTKGTIRYRIAWSDGRHRRAEVWSAAELVEKRAPELVNDPTGSTWEVVCTERVAGEPGKSGVVDVELRPRAWDDPRFSYRRADVPASSHPTIAAALARLAGAREDDVVWDPFCGSGLELCERCLLGPYRALYGSDASDDALAIAERNLKSAGVKATLRSGDARELRPPGVTTIVTNPPMGRRVGKKEELRPLLDEFLANAERVLAPGGRLVWISPMAGTAKRAEALGLATTLRKEIDMGGFHAELQAFEKGTRRGNR